MLSERNPDREHYPAWARKFPDAALEGNEVVYAKGEPYPFDALEINDYFRFSIFAMERVKHRWERYHRDCLLHGKPHTEITLELDVPSGSCVCRRTY